MGLTPTGGIISGTRTGDIDPGVLLYIFRGFDAEKDGISAADRLETLVDRESPACSVFRRGFPICAICAPPARQGNTHASTALAAFTYVLRKYIGSYIAALEGLDMLIFTGGIGEHGSKNAAGSLLRAGSLRRPARFRP